jgi:hypothetical protein
MTEKGAQITKCKSVQCGAKARQKDGKRQPVRQVVFFCLDFSLLLSFHQGKESKRIPLPSSA